MLFVYFIHLLVINHICTLDWLSFDFPILHTNLKSCHHSYPREVSSSSLAFIRAYQWYKAANPPRVWTRDFQFVTISYPGQSELPCWVCSDAPIMTVSKRDTVHASENRLVITYTHPLRKKWLGQRESISQQDMYVASQYGCGGLLNATKHDSMNKLNSLIRINLKVVGSGVATYSWKEDRVQTVNVMEDNYYWLYI